MQQKVWAAELNRTKQNYKKLRNVFVIPLTPHLPHPHNGHRTNLHHDQARRRPTRTRRPDHLPLRNQRFLPARHEDDAGRKSARRGALRGPLKQAFLRRPRGLHVQRPRGVHGLGRQGSGQDRTQDHRRDQPSRLRARHHPRRLLHRARAQRDPRQRRGGIRAARDRVVVPRRRHLVRTVRQGLDLRISAHSVVGQVIRGYRARSASRVAAVEPLVMHLLDTRCTQSVLLTGCD
mmetsp:Transcript_2652/g.9310  ORF Transcript_2652/g.9310 Transcript_2652/m.9310 type:complete len:234 (+) Transcript_2652:177-878(+)